MDLLSPKEIGSRIARKRAEVGLSPIDLGKSIGVSTADVQRLEAGILDPVPGDWILLAARVLKVDYRYLISTTLDREEEATRRVYRALRNPTPRDEYALRRFFSFASDESDFREMMSRPLPSLPPKYRLPAHGNYKRHGHEVAEAERQRLKQGTAPIRNPFDLLRSHGVLLFRQQLSDSALAGITAMHPRIGVCTLVNYDDDLYRQFFSAAHEYAHVLMDRDEVESTGYVVSYHDDRKSLIEVRANAFASALLLPRNMLRSISIADTDDDLRSELLKIGRRYRVNTQVVLYSLQDIGKLTKDRTSRLASDYPRIPRAEKLDPDLPPSLTDSQVSRRLSAIRHGLDMRYVEVVRSALVEHIITLGRAAEALDVPVAQVESFLAELGASQR